MRLAPRSLLAALAALALAACGDDEPPSRQGTANAAFDAAMEAVSKADWDALQPLLTFDGQDHLQRDLRPAQLLLRDPKHKDDAWAQVKAARPSTTEAEFAKARDGTVVDFFRFAMTVQPRQRKPKITQMRIEQNDVTHIGYLDVGGVERIVTLKKVKGRWYVDNLPL